MPAAELEEEWLEPADDVVLERAQGAAVDLFEGAAAARVGAAELFGMAETAKEEGLQPRAHRGAVGESHAPATPAREAARPQRAHVNDNAEGFLAKEVAHGAKDVLDAPS